MALEHLKRKPEADKRHMNLAVDIAKPKSECYCAELWNLEGYIYVIINYIISLRLASEGWTFLNSC